MYSDKTNKNNLKHKVMKNQNISEETKAAIKEYLALNEKFKGAYFFTPPSNSGARRSYEEKNSFKYNNEADGIELKFIVDCSCKNVYVKREIKINGEYKTAAALKKYVK